MEKHRDYSPLNLRIPPPVMSAWAAFGWCRQTAVSSTDGIFSHSIPGFAVKEDSIIYGKEAHMFSRPLESLHKEEMLRAEDESGMALVPLTTPHLGHAFRGTHIVLNTGSTVYVSV